MPDQPTPIPEKEKPKDSLLESEALMKTMFTKMTEVILGSCKTQKDGIGLLISVGKWFSLILASIVVMTNRDKVKAFLVIDRYLATVAKETKAHYIMISGIKDKADGKEPSRIIVPGNG